MGSQLYSGVPGRCYVIYMYLKFFLLCHPLSTYLSYCAHGSDMITRLDNPRRGKHYGIGPYLTLYIVQRKIPPGEGRGDSNGLPISSPPLSCHDSVSNAPTFRQCAILCQVPWWGYLAFPSGTDFRPFGLQAEWVWQGIGKIQMANSDQILHAAQRSTLGK